MHFIDDTDIQNKRVLMRVDFNVPLSSERAITNDERIKQTIPTIQTLLAKQNRLILMSHLGSPKSVDPAFSLEPIIERLQQYLPGYTVRLIRDYENPASVQFSSEKEILLLENLRFHPGEKKNDPEFAKQLASLADIYVNDAFSTCHRAHASVVGVPGLIPPYGGLLLKKEIAMLTKILKDPQKPFVAILGGSKISTKINLISIFLKLTDHVLLAGGLAHNFFLVQGKQIGKSISEPDQLEVTRQLLEQSREGQLILPVDVAVGDITNPNSQAVIKKVSEIGTEDAVLDIGPETQKLFAEKIAAANMIVWNGPVGLFENPAFAKGSDAVYQAIITNERATSVLGGGDTLSAIAGKPGKDKITHISTGGGAMLEFIENGTLPGIEALKTA